MQVNTAAFLIRTAVESAVTLAQQVLFLLATGFGENPRSAPICRKMLPFNTKAMNQEIMTQETLPRLAISVAEFGNILGLSERSAWIIVKNEERNGLVENRASKLPLIEPLEGGKTRRLRMSDVQRWLDAQ